VKRTLLCAVLLTVGCAARQPPTELVDARAAYERARVGPAAKLNTSGLGETKKILDEAEHAYAKGGRATRHLAYIAHRRALAAEAEARRKVAEAERVKAGP
jgi:hypothetical protein